MCENIYDELIYELFDRLNSQEGYSAEDLRRFIINKQSEDKNIKLRTMQSKLNKICEIKRKTDIDGSKIRYYKLKPEYIDHYKEFNLE